MPAPAARLLAVPHGLGEGRRCGSRGRREDARLRAGRRAGRGAPRRNHLGSGAATRHAYSASVPQGRSRTTVPTATAAPAWSRSRASACWRPRASARPGVGMKVKTATERATKARAMVMELLVADQPRAGHLARSDLALLEVRPISSRSTASRFPAAERWAGRRQPPCHAGEPRTPASSATCACAPAARSRSTTSSAWPTARTAPRSCSTSTIPWGSRPAWPAASACRRARPGALMPAAYLDENQTRTVYPDREVNSLCPYCGVGCQVSYKVKDEKIIYAEGRDGPANHNRLCVKGRFGFDYIHHPHRLTKPLVRLDNVAKDANDQVDPANPWTHFREASWEEALDRAAGGPEEDSRHEGQEGAGRLRLGQGLQRGGLPVPEAGAHRASARTTSITARACATPRRWRRSWRG